VRPAAELKIRDRGQSSIGKWNHVVKLEKAAFRAPALGSNERTLAPIAFPDFAFDVGRHVTRA